MVAPVQGGRGDSGWDSSSICVAPSQRFSMPNMNSGVKHEMVPTDREPTEELRLIGSSVRVYAKAKAWAERRYQLILVRTSPMANQVGNMEPVIEVSHRDDLGTGSAGHREV